MYRTLRQRRYEDLLKMHFAPFEARVLSGIKRNSLPPYFKDMVADRREAWRSFWSHKKNKDKPLTAFYTSVLLSYHAKRFATKNRRAKSVSAVYAMFRHYEDKYYDNPENRRYDSPYKKKLKDFSAYEVKTLKRVAADLMENKEG